MGGKIGMSRDRNSEQQLELEKNCSNERSGARGQSAWSRREFLTSSTGLAMAGVTGILAGSHSLSAHEMAARASAPGSSALLSAPGKPRRIIIDTDPGIDDAMAIFLALRSPELKVEAITPSAAMCHSI